LLRKPRCTVTIDWVLANCRTQKAFFSPENAMFVHHCLLAEKRVTTPSHLSRKKLLHFLYPLACFSLLYVGLLLHGQASKSRMDLWNTLYYSGDQTKQNEVGGACSTYGTGERCIQDFGGET
jgi:hypothetical protein